MHNILIEAEMPIPEKLSTLIEETVTVVLAEEKVPFPCEINVLLTNDEEIEGINLEMRDVDRPTDVLSFPMFDCTPGVPPSDEDFLDPEGLLPLGDIVLSLERIQAQGEEYGHGFYQEARYLLIHSVLHLLGYDHMDEGREKKQMRDREKAILQVIQHKGE